MQQDEQAQRTVGQCDRPIRGGDDRVIADADHVVASSDAPTLCASSIIRCTYPISASTRLADKKACTLWCRPFLPIARSQRTEQPAPKTRPAWFGTTSPIFPSPCARCAGSALTEIEIR